MNVVLYAFVVGLHILICFILILVVLLQSGKGADAGALMGGSSQTVFGSRGPTTFFHYLTGGAAGLFLLTSLFLSCTPSPGRGSGSAIEDDPEEIASPTPASDAGDILAPTGTPAGDAAATPESSPASEATPAPAASPSN